MSEKAVLINESILAETAEAIRVKEGSTNTIKPINFAEKITSLSTGEDVTAEANEYTSLLTNLKDIVELVPSLGEFETCTFTIESPLAGSQLIYFSSSGIVNTFSFLNTVNQSFLVAKNKTVILFNNEASFSSNCPISGNISKVMAANAVLILNIQGDATITL